MTGTRIIELGAMLGLCGLMGCASYPTNRGHFDRAGRAANVFVAPGHSGTGRVAVLPFRAATELIGASISDMFVTELLKTRRYEMIERSQLSNVLGETEIALSGLTSGQAAQLGQMAGAVSF